MAPKKPVPTPPQKPVPPVTMPESVSADKAVTPESVSADEAFMPVVVAPDDLPRIINVVHIKSGKQMEVSKDYYLRHQEKFIRE